MYRSTFSKIGLAFQDREEEKEYAQLKAPLIKGSLTWVFVFIALLFVPLTFRYFDKHLTPQNYLGITFIVCAVIVFLFRHKLEKYLEFLSVLYVSLMIILYIINMRLILKKQAPYEAFYMGYGFALIQRMLDYRVGNFLVVMIFNMIITVLKFTLVAIPDPALGGLVICLEVFPIILGFKIERADRSLFDSLYKSKGQLFKFKYFMTECLPSQIVILAENYLEMYFKNNAFKECFKSDDIQELKNSFTELLIQHDTIDKNRSLLEMIGYKSNDNNQALNLSQLIELLSKNMKHLQGIKSIKLKALQEEYEARPLSKPNGFVNRTKETITKEEDLVLIKKERKVNQSSRLLAHSPIARSNSEHCHFENSEEDLQHSENNKKNMLPKKIWNITIFPIVWESNEALAVVLDDVTYEKTISELQIADQNKKDLVITLISHELKTPLNGIMGMLDIIKNKLNRISGIKPSDIFYYLEACKNSGLLLLNLINSIVDYSQIKTGELKLRYSKVNIHDLLKRIKPLFEYYCQTKNLELKIHVDDEVPKKIITDQNRLNQILINLLANAFKFTFKGGVEVKVTLQSQNPCLVGFSIKDTGIGISKQDKEKLFQLFGKIEKQSSTTNTYGIGIGLTTTNTLVKMLNPARRKGIEVESEVEGGSTFSFTIQNLRKEDLLNSELEKDDSMETIDEHKEAVTIQEKMSVYTDAKEKNGIVRGPSFLHISKSITSDKGANKNNKQIAKEKPWCLIVDDNPFNLMVAHNIMEERGYNIKTAMNGREAIEIAQDHKKSHKAFQVILMDCQMPVMDGYESTRILKKMMSQGEIEMCPIVAVTANTKDNKHEQLSKEVGMNGYIGKPLQMPKLEKVLREFEEKVEQEGESSTN